MLLFAKKLLKTVKQRTLIEIEHGLTSPPSRLSGRRFLQVKRPNQQYQSTEGNRYKGKPRKGKNTKYTYTYKIHNKDTVSRQVRQAWTAVGLPPWYPLTKDIPL